MLVLSRFKNEQVVSELSEEVLQVLLKEVQSTGEPIRLVTTVVDIRGDKTRLGFEAPQCMPVHRKEVQDAIVRERCA